MTTVADILAGVHKPARYIGGEHNAVARPWAEAGLRCVLVFPDLYEIGMSHQGLQILYHILNRQPDCLAERCYTPDSDMEEALRRHGLPLFSLESRRPLADFDLIGITLPYELCVTNILTVLDLAGLPLYSAEREEHQPLVVAGGAGSMNPEPVAPFFDAVALGDGEELVIELAATLRRCRAAGLSRRRILLELAGIDGVYVPALQGEGRATLSPQERLQVPERVRRRVTQRLAPVEVLSRPLVPLVKIVHDRLGIEIARGCTRGCRFCQAGMLYRPVRERSPGEILQLAEAGIAAGGFEELALLSLSSGDYGCLAPLVEQLMDRFAAEQVSLSMPSLRVGTLTPQLMRQILRVRKTGFTLAPEAGSERLRRFINKGISEDDLLSSCRGAFALGWRLLKLYFMIGLPGETDEDVLAIAALVGRVLRECLPPGKRGGRQLNVSISTFVPKPHTPFQWEAQLSMAQARQRIELLRSALPARGVQLKWHDPRLSFLEGVIARGDRRLAVLIESAWRLGARLDGWGDRMRLEIWQQAASLSGIRLEDWLGARDLRTPLPWDHLDPGVEREFLQQERLRADELRYTPDCRTHGCQGCGLCDFERIAPQLQPLPPEPTALQESARQHDAPAVMADGEKDGRATDAAASGQRWRYRVTYSRLGDIRHLAHLELLQHIFRALRRAGWPLRYSQGFHPSPRVSFAPALPVGVESEEEYFAVELVRPLDDTSAAGAELQRQLAPGLQLLEVALAPVGEAAGGEVNYRIIPPEPPDDRVAASIARFLAAPAWPVERLRGGVTRQVDLRPLVRDVRLEGDSLLAVVLADPGRPGLGPQELLIQVAGYDEASARRCRVRKLRRREEYPSGAARTPSG